MPTKRKKISALPLASSLKGLHTIGVDNQNKSVKVSLEFVETAADNADKATAAANASKTAADGAASAANAAKSNADDAAIAANAATTNADKATTGATSAAKSANDAAETAIQAAESVGAAIASALATEISERESGDRTTLSNANQYTEDRVARLVDSSPETLDTLHELAEALGNDPNFATTVLTKVGEKVDKVVGKGLSQEDYTTQEKLKLQGITNYDDKLMRAAMESLQRQLDTLLNGNVNGVIDAFNEIETFLAGITDLQTLAGLLTQLRQEIIDMIPAYDAATPTAPGLMSAEDKKRLDSTPRSLDKRAVISRDMAIWGGCAYYYTGVGGLNITGAGVFSDDADYSTLTVPANISVMWMLGEFRLASGMSSITGTNSQLKVYTIRRMPVMGSSGYAYVVDCVLYI